MKAVLDTKPTSAYDDSIYSHYHFPRRYLPILKKCEGDWVVLRRPRADGGNLAYFATARIREIETDVVNPGMSYARFDDFVQFDTPVPWNIDGQYQEEALRRIPKQQVGIFLRGRSARELNDFDFSEIIQLGMSKTILSTNVEKLVLELRNANDGSKAQHTPSERDRVVGKFLTNRVIRNASFRSLVTEAYQGRCAFTGFRIKDKDGNTEAQAAHIWSVANGGPDVVQNGIAMSATVHWLFDRYLVSLSDEYRILKNSNLLPPEIALLFNDQKDRILLPKEPNNWPHSNYLAKHRAKFERLL